MKTLQELVTEKKAAVVIVDVQNDYCHPEGSLGQRGADVSGVAEMMPNLHRLLDSARAHEVPLIFIQTFHEDATDSEAWRERSAGKSSSVCRKGSWGAEFYEVEPAPGEIVVNKHRYSAFINTRLDTILRTLGIETLIMTGVSTNVCVESTARDGYMLDYHIVMLKDACASYSREAHDMTMTNISGYFGTVTDTSEVIQLWDYSRETAALR
ncbi:cysteine hydrolase family protein [Paenibacillus physcomitrellae]|uniref:Isochorismatase n=1 Tax=Paenibacillus physcomitrellae TaxID=1619311 RepID=A0ABQ1FXT5_9BACL|nr:isochorismatase family cysteine hydrolase [Paenibacillus physcomitrellae]GGA33565.1 isochorismatase [Paenibacillus physcomitrellae]